MRVITVHGIRRKNKWYENLAETENAKSFNLEFLNFDYGYFSFWRFLLKSERQKIVDMFCQFYSDNIGSEESPSVIAHSFGTYIVFQSMRLYPNIRFNKIVFCGSILSANTDWRAMKDRTQFNKLKNDHGEAEWFLKHTSWLIDKDCGEAGRIGFIDIHPKHKNEILNSPSYLNHSQYFLPIHMNKNWLEFITDELSKIEYDKNIFPESIIDRIYKNFPSKGENFKIHEIMFNARVDRQGNYYAKYVKKGINNGNNLLDTIHFNTTGDGIHTAEQMSFGAYTLDNIQLHHTITKDYNHQKEFRITFPNPITQNQAIELKLFFAGTKQ